MRAKKTIKVEDVKLRVNRFLKHTKDDMKKERISMGLFLESILHDTGNYIGFRYLNPEDMEDSAEGITYGIDYTAGTCTEDWFKNSDHSRVFYS